MPAFPYKLHKLLETVENDEEMSAIISWLPDGKSFKIHSQDVFEKRLLNDYFPRQTQIKSFKRQLQYYDFENYGDGLFSHPCFVRGQRHMCGQILHQLPTKSQKASGRSTRPLKARGRKKKDRSSPRAHYSSMDPDGTVTTMSLNDSSSLNSDSSIVDPKYRGRISSLGQELRHLEDPSPTCVKALTLTAISKYAEDEFGKNSNAGGRLSLGKMVPQSLLAAPILEQQYLARQQTFAVAAQYQRMQKIQRMTKYLSCLQQQQQQQQQEMMLGSMMLSGTRCPSMMTLNDCHRPAAVASNKAMPLDPSSLISMKSSLSTTTTTSTTMSGVIAHHSRR